MESEFPDWANFTPERAAEVLPRLLEESERAIATIEKAGPSTYEGLVWASDDATRELWQTWGAVSHLMGVRNSDAWRTIEARFQPQIVAFSLRVSQSRRLYELASSVQESDPTRRRILSKIVQSAELAGVGLEGEAKARFNDIQVNLAKLSTDFHNAVIDATSAFSFEKDGKTYTIDDAAYVEAMKNCGDRSVRERLYRARATRAPENAARIEEILALRSEEARLLGFPDYAARSLATKCAPSVAAVWQMIDELDAATVKRASEEETELGEGVEPWDVTYLAERLRERKYAYSEDKLKRFFELEDVLRGLFRLTKFLFDVDVEEIPAEHCPSTWHSDVRFFCVREKGRPIAHFYFDPYVRPGEKSGGAWMNEFVNRRVNKKGEIVLPLAVIVTNFPRRDESDRCLLPFREVETLFHEFGHALQQMLTRVDEEGAAGINLVEWDAVEVASQFMENWCLDDHTGIFVPEELKRKVRAARNFRAATVCRRQLAFAATDLRLHEAARKGRAPDAVKEEMFGRFGLPRINGDLFLCAFTHLFVGGYAAGYYGYKWAEVMSADCYGAFEEAGLSNDEALAALGRKYRETILSLGGSKSALEVFREFRGRDPATEAILRQQDLI